MGQTEIPRRVVMIGRKFHRALVKLCGPELVVREVATAAPDFHARFSARGRTYRYFTGEPLYPFGFGLSYTQFKYDKLKLSARKVKAGDTLSITAQVLAW